MTKFRSVTSTEVKIDKTKADRLLTLPRMQRDNPPEHLIRSLDGDYLRGRLLEMDDRHLQVECRLDTRTIERTQVSSGKTWSKTKKTY